MRFLLAVLVLAAAWTTRAQGTMEAIQGYANNAVVGTFVNETAGWTFQVTNAITVTELGCVANFFPNNQTTNPLQVGLWAPNGVLLASNSITPSSTLVNQSLYETVDPAFLLPGQTYHIGVYFPDGSFSLDVAAPSFGGSVFPSLDIVSLAAARGSVGFASPPEQSGTAGAAYLGPNFRYNLGVPEPSFVALLGLGALLVAARRSSRTR